MPMQIMLSTQVADEAWGKNALLSFSSGASHYSCY